MQILKGNNFRLILYAANLLQISNDKCENFQNYLIFKTCQTALLKTFIIKYFNNMENFHISNQQQRRQREGLSQRQTSPKVGHRCACVSEIVSTVIIDYVETFLKYSEISQYL